MTLRQEGAAGRLFLQKMLSYEADGVDVFKIVSSVRQNQRVEWSKVFLVTVEVSPVGSKPPAAVGERISEGERHDLGAASPFSTTTSSLQGRAGGSTSMAKLVEHIGSVSTRLAEKLSPCIA